LDLPAENLTLTDIAERFFRHIRERLAPATVSRYEEHWKHHVEPTLGKIVASKLKPPHIADLLAKLSSEPVVYIRAAKAASGEKCDKRRVGKALGGTSLVRVYRFLHRMMRWAERMELVGRNVAAVVEAPRQSSSNARALTSDEAATLLLIAEGSRFYPFLFLALTTGMRRGELAALQWNDVDVKTGLLSVRRAFGEDRRGGCFIKATKSGRERVIPIAPASVDVLKAVHARQSSEKLATKPGTYRDQDFVFADQLGNPPELNALSKSFAKLAKSAGIKGVTLHSCRHFTATSAIAEGSDIRSVAAVMGHAQPSTTLNVYGHVVADATMAAVRRVNDVLALAQARCATYKNRPIEGATANQKEEPSATKLQPTADVRPGNGSNAIAKTLVK
jgi:integrase